MQLARMRAELAARGLYSCMGKCKQVKPLNEGIVVTWGGNVMMSICPECFPTSPVVFKRTEAGVRIEFLNDSPLEIPTLYAEGAAPLIEPAIPKWKSLELGGGDDETP